MLELRICGGVELEVDGRVLSDSLIGGRQGRLVLAYLVCARDRAVRREELADLLWPDQLPETWTASLSAIISRLRRLFSDAGFDGPAVVASTPGAYQLHLPAESRVDLDDLIGAVADAEDAAASDADRLAAAARADAIAARGFLADDCDWVDARRDEIRDLRVRAAIAQSVAHLGAGSAARAIDAARRAVELDDSKEAAYRQLMLALAAAGERAEALRVWERCRIALVEELGVDPSRETEAVYLQILDATPAPAVTTHLPSGVVTFLLTDIVESSAMWEEHASAMATALERHDALIGRVVATHGGTLLKSKLEGDATVSVFARATEGAAAALTLVDALVAEPWPDGAQPRLRMAIHTGEAFERGGDYFGPALNRAARLRGLAAANEILVSQAAAELVRDHLPEGVTLHDRGLQPLRGLSRGENIFELARRMPVADTAATVIGAALDRPPVPSALAGAGPFVGRGDELAQLDELWQHATSGTASAVLVGGEPGVGKSRLAGELARHAFDRGGLVLYGRCDEDLGAPLQPFIEAARTLAPALGAARLRAVRGVDELTRVLPELTDLIGEKPGVRADPDTERLALFDAVTQLLTTASNDVPILLVLDDLHWAGKTTLSLLRHLLRGAKDSHLLVVGTYRDTELARTHPLAETLADLRRDTATHRIGLSGLPAADVAAYLDAIGNTDRALGRELAEVTAGNPFFLIEVLRHVEESGGSWQPGSLPEGVREATGRRLSRLSDAANEALAVAAVVGTTFDLALVEEIRGGELIDPIAEALQAGLVIEEPGSLARFRFAHALVRQVLLSELVSLKRVRLHRTIAELLEAAPATSGEDARLADLAYHWFECASTGSADKAVAACRQAADRALERLAYEEAADLYGMALQALEWVNDADADIGAALHLARCDALLTAGDVAGARDAIDALELAAGSERLAAWYTTYEGLLAVLGEPDRLTEIVQSIAAAAGAMHDLGDGRGEAKARYVHALALERLGQIGAAERALDGALAAARESGDRRLADAILAEAPPAALWGPSPVTRASGRCLDVVRVLRITSATAAVEAVALRCQAVLEALRGRMPAARRMVGASRRTVEQLGLTHRLLEADVAAGYIELLDGEPVAAEGWLRDAYEGLRERGLGGEAAQAGAFLARALLMLDRVEEADAIAAQAEALAGSDLKAAIAWRTVRAHIALHIGDTDRALVLAREAVEVAGATDALLLVADARLTLATVLRATGDVVGADTEARHAYDVCDQKGATVLAALARAAMTTPASVTEEATAAVAAPRPLAPNLATATAHRNCEALNRGDWDAVAATVAPNRKVDDRRPLVGTTGYGDHRDSLLPIVQGGGRLDPPELLATRGAHAELSRWMLRSDAIEVPFLAITHVDRDGRIDEFIMFEPEAIEEALAVLNGMAQTLGLFENEATRAEQRLDAAMVAGDWDTVLTQISDTVTQEDRRSIARVLLDRDAVLKMMQLVFKGKGTIASELLATRGQSLALFRWSIHVPEPEATDTVLAVLRVDGAGRQQHVTVLDSDDVDAAFAELDLAFAEHEGTSSPAVVALGSALLDSLVERDTNATHELLAPDFRVRDHRALVGLPERNADEWLADLDSSAQLFAGGRARAEHIAGVSPTGGVWSVAVEGEQADDAPWAARLLYRLRVTGDRIAAIDFYDEGDIAATPNALETIEHERPVENSATRLAQRGCDAYNARDWDALLRTFGSHVTQEDRRGIAQVAVDRDAILVSSRWVFDGRGVCSCDVVATRGQELALVRWSVAIPAPEATESVLAILAAGDEGIEHSILLDDDDMDAALAELDRLFAARGTESLTGNAAWRASQRVLDALNRRDWDAFVAAVNPRFEFVDEYWRLHQDGDDAFANHRVLFGLDEFGLEYTLLATRGDRLALLHSNTRFRDGNSGIAEIAFLNVIEADEHGRWRRQTQLAPDDLAGAYKVLEARHAELDGDRGNDAWRATQRVGDALNRRDWDAFADAVHPEFETDDRYWWIRQDGDGALANNQVLFGLDEFHIEFTLLETRGDRLALVRADTSFRDGDAGAAEIAFLTVIEADDRVRQRRITQLGPDDFAAAYEVLEARYAELEARPGNAAWRAAQTISDAMIRGDLPAFVAALHPEFEYVDYHHRLHQKGDDAQASFRLAFNLDEFSQELTLEATRGDRLALLRTVASFRALDTGLAEIAAYNLTEVDEQGLMTSLTAIAPEERERAHELLEARFVELEAARGNAAWRAAQRFADAMDRRDLAAFEAGLHTAFEFVDHHHQLHHKGEEARASFRLAFDLDEYRPDLMLEATRGDRLALIRTVATFRSGASGLAEIVRLGLYEVDDQGRMTSLIAIAPDQRAVAFELLEARFAELDAAPPSNRAWAVQLEMADAFNRRDIARFEALTHPDFEWDERRSGLAGHYRGEAAQEGMRVLFAMDRAIWSQELVATAGDRLAVFTALVRGSDGAVGEAEWTAITMIELAPDGRLLRLTAFDEGAVEDAMQGMRERAAAIEEMPS